MGIAQTKALVLHLTAPAPSHGHKRRIAAYPLLATRRLHERCRGIATKTTMRTDNGLGVHPMGHHPRLLVPWCGYACRSPRSLCRGITPRLALSSWAIFI